jgi:XTP/dITP diphosphohydrolase
LDDLDLSRPKLALATANEGKVREIREILGDIGWEIIVPADEAIELPGVIETARSYAENAILKAVALARVLDLPALADDSGLEVDALDGRPGVTSARYGGPSVRTPQERNARLLAELEGVPPARRTARFRAVIALAVPGNRTITREGMLEGRIALEPRGDNGFGYDPVFELPDGRTLAEIGEEKQRLSHRAVALDAIKDVLAELVARPEYESIWRGVPEMSPFRRVERGH